MNDEPYNVDHHMLGQYLKWPDGKCGYVGAISTMSSEGVTDPDLYPHPERAAFAGRRRASMVLLRRVDKVAKVPPLSWPITDRSQLAGRILAKPRTKATQ